MNSQQELIDVIKDIAKKQNHTYDTPATVLRVEGDTVWVHIDGGADETPVRKTINCEQGEIVQVRISNGSAFLVGNASAPPTDDKTAKVAHFMAEEAGVRAVEAQDTAAEAQERATIAQTAAAAAQAAVAQSLITYETWYKLSADTPTQPTEDSHEGWSTAEPAWSSSSTDKLYFSVRTVKGDGTATWSAVGMVQSYADLQILKNAIISTVANNYVAQGDSGVTELSSTMLQNSNGVNIYNDTLAVGDSYAHIDGDSFDIKEATTAGTIDDANDKIVASFGENSYMQSRDAIISSLYYKLHMASDSIKLAMIETSPANRETGWKIDGEKIVRYGDIYSGVLAGIDAGTGKIYIQDANLQMGGGGSYMNTNGHARFFYTDGYGTVSGYTDINQYIVTIIDDANEIYYYDPETEEEGYIDNKTVINGGRITIADDIYDSRLGTKKYIREPRSEGSNGQVLTTDGNGGRKWTNAGGSAGPTILTSSTISASTTSYTFSDASITTDSVIDIYDTIFGFSPTNMTVSNGSCTITFPAQSSTHKIKLFVY